MTYTVYSLRMNKLNSRKRKYYSLILWTQIGVTAEYRHVMFGWSLTDVSVLGSYVFIQASMEGCDKEHVLGDT